MVCHHPWVAAWRARGYPTPKRGPLARLLRARWSERYRLIGSTTLKLDVVLDDVLRYSYNRSRQRLHLLWAQPILSRSLRQVGNSLLGRGDYGEGRYHMCRHDRVGDLAEP